MGVSVSLEFVTLKEKFLKKAFPSYGFMAIIEFTGGILTLNYMLQAYGIKYLISWANILTEIVLMKLNLTKLSQIANFINELGTFVI